MLTNSGDSDQAPRYEVCTAVCTDVPQKDVRLIWVNYTKDNVETFRLGTSPTSFFNLKGITHFQFLP